MGDKNFVNLVCRKGNIRPPGFLSLFFFVFLRYTSCDGGRDEFFVMKQPNRSAILQHANCVVKTSNPLQNLSFYFLNVFQAY